MTTLRHLHVEGFKSIRTLDLDLRSLNVLVGANGSGKSNLLAFFQLLNAIADRRLGLHTITAGADSFLYFGRETTPQITFHLKFNNTTSAHFSHHVYAVSLVPTSNDTLVINNEISSSGPEVPTVSSTPFYNELLDMVNNDTASHSFKYYSGEPIPESWVALNADQDERDRLLIDTLLGCKLYHFEDTSETAKVKDYSELDDDGVLWDDAGNLAAALYVLRIRQRPYYDRLLPIIRSVVPFFDDFVLEPDEPNKIRLRWRHKGRSEVFTAHALSDGTLRFMCLAALLLQPTLPPLIILDEPELGLHPDAVSMLGSLLKSAAARTQVIVATQSVTLIDQMDFSNILVAERIGNESQFHWLDSEAHLRQWLEEYTLGQIWEMNLYGGTTPAVHEAQP